VAFLGWSWHHSSLLRMGSSRLSFAFSSSLLQLCGEHVIRQFYCLLLLKSLPQSISSLVYRGKHFKGSQYASIDLSKGVSCTRVLDHVTTEMQLWALTWKNQRWTVVFFFLLHFECRAYTTTSRASTTTWASRKELGWICELLRNLYKMRASEVEGPRKLSYRSQGHTYQLV
jgi:hypothetical protein